MTIDEVIKSLEDKVALLKSARDLLGNGNIHAQAKPVAHQKLSGRGHPIGVDEIARIKSMRKAGNTLAEIGKQTGRHVSTVWNTINRH